jgi:hypothetical protein
MKRPSKGFVLVASRFYAYYDAAHNLIESILDHYPEADIALFAHDEWTKDDPRCDKLYMVHDAINHVRAKLWALPQTPFETTVYLDVDTYVCHDDITDMFELNGNDMMFTNIRKYAGKISKFDGGELTLHGGAFAYNSTPSTLEFMNDWYYMYDRQIKDKWWPKNIGPKDQLVMWDQFTLWFLVKTTDIKVGIYKDDARYNFIRTYRENECEGEIVVWHYSIPNTELLLDERNINQKPRDIN